MFRCPVGTFSKDQTLAFFKYCENNRKISLSPQEPGTCTYRNTFLTGAPLAMVTVGPGWLAGVGEVQRYKVTSQHQPQPTPPPLPGSARARATRYNTAHHTAQHTAHRTLHSTHTVHNTGHTDTRCWRQGPCPRSVSCPPARPLQPPSASGSAAPAETLRPGTSPAAGGGWPATQQQRSSAGDNGENRKPGRG